MATLLCVPILVHDAPAALADAQAAKDAGADLVEFRIDEFFDGSTGAQGQAIAQRTVSEGSAASGDPTDAILRLVADSPLPCIVTCRPSGPEGGHYDGDESARISLFERLGTAFGPGEHPPRFIDVELSTLERSANIRQKIRLAVDHPEQLRDLQTSLIVSTHDFESRPADLARRVVRMQGEPGAKVVKVAFRARSLRDNLELFDLLRHAEKPMIALGMGEFGLMSRVLAPKFSAFLTFASLRAASATAPGQPTVRELLDLYRFRSIGPATAVYGVIGWPVAHSLSPLVHNAGFEALGYDGVYLPMPVAAGEAPSSPAGSYESLKATLTELIDHPALILRGLSVTLPHKENLVRLAAHLNWKLDDASRRIGAANSVRIERGPEGNPSLIEVWNTDTVAAGECLESAVGGGATLQGRRVAVIGAGGVARAVAYASASRGASVVILNRTPERAERLAADLRPFHRTPMVGAPLADLGAHPSDLYVNCTPIGMAGAPESSGSPIPISELGNFSPGAVVWDTVYNPVRTALLRAAEDAGLKAIDGVAMFVAQASAQFQAWTGTPAPRALFDRIVRERLGA